MLKSKIDFNKYWSPVFDTMSEFVYLLDKDFNVIKVNKAVVDFTRKKESSLTGRKCYKAIYGVNTPIAKDCPYKRMLKSRKFETLELFIPGKGKWLNIRTNPVFDEKNDLIGGITFSEDITEHKKIEEEREKLLKAVEHAREAVSITSLEDVFRIIYTNNAFDKLFGCKKGELIGKDVTLLNAVSKRDELTREITTALMKEGLWEGEIPNIKKNGTEFLSFVTISTIKDNRGKITGSIATQHDITGRKKAEDALRKSEEEFRITFENAKDAIFWADFETGRIAHKKKKKRKVSLVSVINEILKGLTYLISGKNLQVNIDVPENAKNVIIDRKYALILMSNLLDNAVKFTDKGSISIKSRLKGGEIEITVKDTGCGIDHIDIKRVFDKFYKRHPAVEGTGLGLAICKEIVNIYKGTIEVKSKGKKQGAKIIVNLPKG
ncbi:MAG: PAS domain-containing sensor histidine kinase [bacterium]